MKADQIIKRFVADETSVWEWDDFISKNGKSYAESKLKTFCPNIQIIYPGNNEGEYCSEEGVKRLLEAAEYYHLGEDHFLNWLSNFEEQLCRRTN